MFVFTHGEEPNQTVDYRYIGNQPKNYVKFNCDNDGTNCEIWRILGVFDVDDGTGNVELRMKLVRGNAFATTSPFNSSNKNDWTISPLNTFLNGDYYNRSRDAETYGLKESARSMIDDALYYLGAVPWVNVNNNWGNIEKIYNEERGTTLCGDCNSDITKLTWTGKVALMYPSDAYMVYAKGVDDNFYNNPHRYSDSLNAVKGWVYSSNIREGQTSKDKIALLSSSAGYSIYRLISSNEGCLDTAESNLSVAVRPVIYLSTDVKIDSGTGTQLDPYVLKN